MEKFFDSDLWIPWFAFFASLLISAFMQVYIHHPIAFDAIGNNYLAAASAFKDGHYDQILNLYSWPFYSITLGAFSKLFNCDPIVAVTYLDSFDIAIATFSFVLIVRELGGDKIIQLIGAFLFLTFYYINATRVSLGLRDFGYWACFLSAFVCLIRYARYAELKYAVGWNILIFLAFLFRVEGVAFLIGAPIVVLFLESKGFKHGIVNITKLYILPIFFSVVVFIVGMYFHEKVINHLGRAYDIFVVIPSQIYSNFTNWVGKVIAIKSVALDPHFGTLHEANWFAIFGVIGVLIYHVFDAIGVSYGLIVLYVLANKKFYFDKTASMCLRVFLAINLFILLIFFIRNSFLDYRYVLPTAFLLAGYVPFGLHDLYSNFRDRNGNILIKILFPIIIIIIAISVYSGFDRGKYTDNKIPIASEWIKQNTEKNSILLTNDIRFGYYSNRKYFCISDGPAKAGTNNIVDFSKIKNYKSDYLVFIIDKNEIKQQLLSSNSWEFIMSFKGYKASEIMIFKKK